MKVQVTTNSFYDLYQMCWAGALKVLDEIQLAEKTNELMVWLDSVFDCDDNIPSDIDINDYIWFECDEIYEALGMKEVEEEW